MVHGGSFARGVASGGSEFVSIIGSFLFALENKRRRCSANNSHQCS